MITSNLFRKEPNRGILSILRHISEKYTHFGYQQVPEEEKAERVHDVFANVAKSYDDMNDAMSFGLHRIWKDAFMRYLNPGHNVSLLDVAGGTGDIAFRFLKYNSGTGLQNSSNRKVTVCDINQAMLDVGKKRAGDLDIDTEKLSWVCGDAEKLPFEDKLFDAYTIAFCIRNCTHIQKVLEEAYRVLKPGGRFQCLEFSRVNHTILRRLYDAYSFQVIPVMGEVIAGDWKSYQYLVESIRQFPDQETFAEAIRNMGFKSVEYSNMTFGAVAIHSGFKV
ncbi:2-methoxy-6-polyprenyl-1,4-benzoquinol methylase, mitochondrial-like [Styela clava]